MVSLPKEFCDRIRHQMSDAEEFLAAIATPPFVSVRLNKQKLGDTGLALGEKVPWCEHAYYLTERPVYTLNPTFHAGRFYPQEASSIYLWHVLRHVEGLLPEEPIVLDLCAAPGGKSTLIHDFLGGRGVLVSNEIVRQRAWILRENIAKWGPANAIVTNGDAAQFGSRGAMFDLLLIDAPCSGEGMFRKDEVAINEWSAGNAAQCAVRQREIFDHAWRSVVEGGVVIYSTCTFNPAENEENMAYVAENYDVEFLRIPVVENAGVTVVPFVGGEGYAFYPHKVRGEGFFICAMRKLSGSKRKLDKKLPKLVRYSNLAYLACPNDFAGYALGEDIVAFPLKNEQIMRQLTAHHSPLLAGVTLGRDTRKGLVPAEELPLSQAFSPSSFPSIDLARRDALVYLQGLWPAEVRIDGEGWSVVRYEGACLGFVKCMGGRVNNYYPKEWRIRMKLDD